MSSVLTCDANWGWLCFYCDIVSSVPPLESIYRGPDFCNSSSSKFKIVPRDAFRTRLFIASFALSIHVEGAFVEWAEIDFKGHRVVIALSTHPGSETGPVTSFISLQQTSNRRMHVSCVIQGRGCQKDRKRHDLYIVPMSSGHVVLEAMVM